MWSVLFGFGLVIVYLFVWVFKEYFLDLFVNLQSRLKLVVGIFGGDCRLK